MQSSSINRECTIWGDVGLGNKGTECGEREIELFGEWFEEVCVSFLELRDGAETGMQKASQSIMCEREESKESKDKKRENDHGE